MWAVILRLMGGRLVESEPGHFIVRIPPWLASERLRPKLEEKFRGIERDAVLADRPVRIERADRLVRVTRLGWSR